MPSSHPSLGLSVFFLSFFESSQLAAHHTLRASGPAHRSCCSGYRTRLLPWPSASIGLDFASLSSACVWAGCLFFCVLVYLTCPSMHMHMCMHMHMSSAHVRTFGLLGEKGEEVVFSRPLRALRAA